MSGQSRERIVTGLSNDPRVQVALLDYFASQDRGEPVDRDAFLVQHANIASELRSVIAIDDVARRLAGSAEGSAAPDAPTKDNAETSTHSVVGKVLETSSVGKMPSPDAPTPRPKSALLPKPHADLPAKFGRYLVKKKLGEGAMGAVYLAEDTLLQRKVALKTPTFDDDANGELLKRFYREARAVAILKHPNLCAVYDVGEIDGRHYISMEFVAGRKLQEFIKPDQPLSEKQAMAAVRKIALAMQEAHALGVIHRDLKPDNIMVNEKGDPVVMDFGLVHKTERKSSTKITKHGTLVGSPAYMSKEQVEGDPDKLTVATDQYSLGVILYQLLTSKLPFEGGIHALLGAILTKEPPPPSHYRPDLNPHLEAVCLKMMAKEAGDRYPSMKAATDALAEVVRGTSTAGGSSAPVRPTGGSPSDASLETTLDFMPVHLLRPTSEFEINSLIERPIQEAGVLRRFASLSRNSVLYGNLAAVLAVLFAISLWMRSVDSLVKVEVQTVGFEVTFKEAGITVKAGLHEANVKPGDHTLHIQSDQSNNSPASEGFDTEQFSLTRGDKPVVTVKLENMGIVARLNGKVILRRSLLPSDLVSQSNGTVGRAAVLDSAMIDEPAERERTPATEPSAVPPVSAPAHSKEPSEVSLPSPPAPAPRATALPSTRDAGTDSVPASKAPVPSVATEGNTPAAPVAPALKPGVRLRDAKPGKLLIAGPRSSWALNEDNTKIVTGTVRGDVELWDAETGARLHAFPDHDERVASIACSPAEPHIVFIMGYANGNVRRLDLQGLTSELVYTLKGVATNLSVSSDGARLLVATGGGNLDILDAKAVKFMESIPGARAPAGFHPNDPSVVFFTRKDSTSTIIEWKFTEAKEIRRYKMTTPGFSSIAVSSDGKQLAAGCGHIPFANGKGRVDQIPIWNTSNSTKLATLTFEITTTGSKVVFSPDGKSVWASGETTVQFDIATGERLSSVNLPGPVQCFQDGRRVLIADSKGIHLCRLRETED